MRELSPVRNRVPQRRTSCQWRPGLCQPLHCVLIMNSLFRTCVGSRDWGSLHLSKWPFFKKKPLFGGSWKLHKIFKKSEFFKNYKIVRAEKHPETTHNTWKTHFRPSKPSLNIIQDQPKTTHFFKKWSFSFIQGASVSRPYTCTSAKRDSTVIK